jgi:acetolactate synthase-1/2/3 large subunit
VSFPHLLVDLHRHGATGSLKVTGPVHPKALYFRGDNGETVEETAQFAPAFERAAMEAEAARRPALIEVRIDPQAITTSTTLDAIRARSLKG